MHEFSLASDIVEIVTESVKKAGRKKVTNLTLEVGVISGVDEDALTYALDSLKPETVLSDSTIEIIRVDGVAKCLTCNTQFPLDDLFTLCPHCQGYEKEIISGKEFNVHSIEAE